MTPSNKDDGAPLAISAQDVADARERIKDGIVATPQGYSKPLHDATGVPLYLKFEIFQHTSSFKARGALNRLLTLTDQEKKRGVIANSAGNHAQGLAFHAQRLGIPATIVMPKGTPFNKVKKTENLGATVVLAGATFQEAGIEARRIRDAHDLVFVSPFDDPDIMAGQGTLALEFLEAFPDLEILVVPIGGGGLISGVAVAAKAINPNIRIIGVQSESYPSMQAALRGESIEPVTHTVAEGIAVKEAGMLTRRVVEHLVDDIIIVSEVAIERAINMLIEVEKVVVEGAGAATLAAVLENKDMFNGHKTGLVLAGGNIDTRILASSLMRGLVHDGRISRLKVTMLDQPGSLANLTRVVADAGANVMEVHHQRQFAAIPLKYTQIELVVETKDSLHRDKVIKALQDGGFEVNLKTLKTLS